MKGSRIQMTTSLGNGVTMYALPACVHVQHYNHDHLQASATDLASDGVSKVSNGLHGCALRFQVFVRYDFRFL